MSFTDRTLECRECGESFTWTAGEQAFYAEKGLLNLPVRCPDCRAAKKRERAQVTRDGRIQHPVTCAECGAETTVPFIPRNERPVYCSTCYDKVRATARY